MTDLAAAEAGVLLTSAILAGLCSWWFGQWLRPRRWGTGLLFLFALSLCIESCRVYGADSLNLPWIGKNTWPSLLSHLFSLIIILVITILIMRRGFTIQKGDKHDD
jgi:hypothetical protein